MRPVASKHSGFLYLVIRHRRLVALAVALSTFTLACGVQLPTAPLNESASTSSLASSTPLPPSPEVTLSLQETKSTSPTPGSLESCRSLPIRSNVAAFSPDEGLIAASSGPGEVSLFKMATGETFVELRIPEGDMSGTMAIAFSPDGDVVAVGGLEQRVDVFDTVSGELSKSLSSADAFGTPVAITGLKFGETGKTVLVSSRWDSGGLAVWDLGANRTRRLFKGPVDAFDGPKDDGQIALATFPLISDTSDREPVTLVDAQTGTPTPVPMNGLLATDVAFLPKQLGLIALVDGQALAYSPDSQRVEQLDQSLIAGMPVMVAGSPTGLVALLSSADFSDASQTLDGPMLMPATRYSLTLFNGRTQVSLSRSQLVGVSDITFSPSGDYIALSGPGMDLRICNVGSLLDGH